MTSEELEEEAGPEQIKLFYQNTLKILERWMKVMCEEEGDIISTLIIDQLFKGMLIKLDSVYVTKEQMLTDEVQKCHDSLRQMKNSCKDKLNL